MTASAGGLVSARSVLARNARQRPAIRPTLQQLDDELDALAFWNILHNERKAQNTVSEFSLLSVA
jgi:hypothetical protein